MSENHFAHSEAVAIITAAIQNGTLKFPFSERIDAQRVIKKVDALRRNPEDKAPIRTAELKEVAAEFAGLARLDALYLLTLYCALTTGLTDKETNFIRDVMLH